MSEMQVSIPVLNTHMKEITAYKNRITKILFSLQWIQFKVKIFTTNNLDPVLNNIKESLINDQHTMSLMKEAVSEITNRYIQTEASILNAQYLNHSDTPDHNPAFDDKGGYGGNQSSPYNNYADNPALIEIVREYYPGMSKSDIKKFLDRMASEGCGYVALTNTIFAQFIGREKEFENTFGFPLYKKDGELNYEAMLTDFYCATDDEDSSGTNMNSRKEIFEHYMQEHNIDVEVHNNLNITAENYNEIARNGEIVVGLQPCILYDADGNVTVDINGGHAMTVTGATSDGMLIVSSWGKKYYIKPGDTSYNRMQFQQIIYN